jgi:hypothetical protein
VEPLSIVALAGVGLAAAGTSWLVRRLVDFRTGRRQLRSTAARPIGQVDSDGKRVKVQGRVEAIDAILAAPFGRHPCVAYRVQVLLMEEHGPRQIADETKHVPFRLDDGTGKARVDDQPIRFALVPTKVFEQAGGGHLHPELREFLREHDLTMAMGEQVVVEQAALELGESAAVLGCSRIVVDPSRAGRTYRDPSREVRFDDLADGPIIVGR